MADDLKPCPFCGGEASAEGYQKWSKPVLNMTWDGGDPITEAYFCNCPTCCVSNITSGIGYRTRAEAIANWNRRAAPTAQEAAKVLLAGLGDFERDRSHPSFEAAFRGYADSNKPAPFNRIGDGLIAALRAIAGEIHD